MRWKNWGGWKSGKPTFSARRRTVLEAEALLVVEATSARAFTLSPSQPDVGTTSTVRT